MIMRKNYFCWAGNVFPRENTETALAHVVGDKAEQAYPRYLQPLQYAHPRPAGFHPERNHKLQPASLDDTTGRATRP
jgi:hypothetical protein